MRRLHPSSASSEVFSTLRGVAARRIERPLPVRGCVSVHSPEIDHRHTAIKLSNMRGNFVAPSAIILPCVSICC